MRKRTVAFVVGHEHWGKSRTIGALKQICGAGRNAWHVTIEGIRFRLRSKSNDDLPEQYEEFIRSFSGDYLIAALCPKFRKLKNYNRKEKAIEAILRNLQRRRYRFVFWVIKHRWSDPTQFISKQEISELRKYGKVEVFNGKRVMDRQRAKVFRRFVSALGPG